MIKFYDQTFFHIYKSLIKSPDKLYKMTDKSYPTLVSLMVLTFVQLANVLAVFLFLDIIGSRIYSYLMSLDFGIGIPIIFMAIIFVFDICTFAFDVT